jgi:carboxyl-terminal processing protease
MQGLIVDLRDNGGGLVDTCTNMLSRMIPEGDLLVYMEDKNGTREEYKSTDKQVFDKPVIILVNGNTASASEIFTGCLKDYGKAKALGVKTYGKGVVQSIIPLNDGTALKLTISEYFTPNGNEIHKKGIEPDIVMEYTTEEWKAARKDPEKDTQLKEALAILQGKK